MVSKDLIDVKKKMSKVPPTVWPFRIKYFYSAATHWPIRNLYLDVIPRNRGCHIIKGAIYQLKAHWDICVSILAKGFEQKQEQYRLLR